MESVRVEFAKLSRSAAWVVVVLLPVLAVLSGGGSTAGSAAGFDQGWHTLWVRSIGFYGMALLPVGVGVLASLVWRPEHRGGNWNALMGGPTSTLRIVIGKAAAVCALAATMQVVLLGTVAVMGTVVFGLDGALPGRYVAASLVVAVACAPVAALQSGVSALSRSFAPPVAVALLGGGIGTVLLLIAGPVATILPYALATDATQLGTVLANGAGTSFSASSLSAVSVARLVGSSVLATVVIVIVTTAILERRDVRT